MFLQIVRVTNIEQICINRENTVHTILIGLEKSSNLIARCAIYESVYLKEDANISRSLEKVMLKVYTAILKYVAKAIEASRSSDSCKVS
jgi:hypothetical protein